MTDEYIPRSEVLRLLKISNSTLSRYTRLLGIHPLHTGRQEGMFHRKSVEALRRHQQRDAPYHHSRKRQASGQ